MENEDALSHRCQRMELDLRIYYRQGTLCPVEKAGELCMVMDPPMAPETATLVCQGKQWLSYCLSSWSRGAH